MFGFRIVYEPRGGFWGVCRSAIQWRRGHDFYIGDVIR
jgi:hypothetical protein